VQQQSKSSLTVLALSALGIVYGDIGTSPLYAFKEAFSGTHGLAVTEENVLATLSALFWAITLIISIKYVWIVLKFDNEGEGGVLALTALAHRLAPRSGPMPALVIGAGIFAAALFYGDAIITPAISVLSAVEGLSVVTPGFERLVIPITLGVLVALFLIQRHGTGKVGMLFGPITVIWFVTLAALGIASIAQTPVVLRALNPGYAAQFAFAHPGVAFMLLAAVFLALTGGEALYADMGHFGAKAVRLAWYGLVCPALLTNYFGQGALVLREVAAVKNPFYLMAPSWLQLPLIVLATAATVIASQATISGAYSMTLQASRLGYLPRVRILHTSDQERGQIYVGSINWLMLIGVLLLVLAFGSSSALAAAYGIAVSGTMIITTLLASCVTLWSPRRYRFLVLAALGLFALLELGFLGSNLTKIASGGWFPLVLGLAVFVLLTTWKRGSGLVASQRRRMDIAMRDFLLAPLPDVPHVAGTAVYLTSDPSTVPSALFHNLKHYKVMHRQTVFLHVINEEVPYVATANRINVVRLAPDIYRVDAHFGFREEPDVIAGLVGARGQELEFDPMTASYFVARSVVVEGPGELPPWRSSLFSWMTRQAEGAAGYFRLPANRVVELGTQVIL
jgi:KUP system potassium uptake protein